MPQSRAVLFIEDNIADYQQLAASVGSGIDVVVLDANEDGLSQMADALAGRKNLSAVHLISHGSKGALGLGALTLDRQAMRKRGADLTRIRAALGSDADLLLYGCDVGQGAEGREFVAMLASATGAQVAASTNLTGTRERGGDWVLERSTGPLRNAALAFPAYSHVLPSVAGTVTIPFAQPDDSFPTQKMTDGQANTGTSDIPGIAYEFYFADTGNTPVGRVINLELGGGTGSMLTYLNTGSAQFDPVGALIIKSQSNRLFGLSSLRIQDVQGLASTYTATAYRNNATVGVPWTFTTGGSFNPILISFPTQFKNVDEIRITSDGGTAVGTVGPKLWQEGFNAFVFIDPTTNADLTGLSASAGALSPAFAANVPGYSFTVGSAVTSTTITPTVDTPGSIVTVNGVTVASGAASGQIALNTGGNTITTVVTAPDGTTTKTYTVTVTRAASSNANLSALSLSSGTLSPAFALATTSYTALVANATTSLTVTPTVADANASITVNGVAVTSGNVSGAIALGVGANTITTVVTAQNGTSTQTYTVTITRAQPPASTNANLDGLSVSAGNLSPWFATATTAYSVTVPNSQTAIIVTPTAADVGATITVNGVPVTSGSGSGPQPLNIGDNTITVLVTAPDGTTTRAYVVTVTREALAPPVVVGIPTMSEWGQG